MRGFLGALGLAAGLLGVAGCHTVAPARTADSVELHVPASGEECTINIQPVSCTAAVHYIRDVLGLTPDRYITLFVQATQASVDLGRQVSTSLQRAGYANIVAAGPMTEPGEEP